MILVPPVNPETLSAEQRAVLARCCDLGLGACYVPLARVVELAKVYPAPSKYGLTVALQLESQLARPMVECDLIGLLATRSLGSTQHPAWRAYVEAALVTAGYPAPALVEAVERRCQELS